MSGKVSGKELHPLFGTLVRIVTMSFNVLSLIYILFPIAIFSAWLIAEFRCRTSIRVGLGLACMFFPILWICAVIYTSDLVSAMHNICLNRIELMIQKGRGMQVRQAIQVYDKTYQETQSWKTAVFRLQSALTEPENKGGEKEPEMNGTRMEKEK